MTITPFFKQRKAVSSSTTWDSANKDSAITLSNGDRTASSSANNRFVFSTTSKSSGKWYVEFILENAVTEDSSIGIANSSAPLSDSNPLDSNSWFFEVNFGGSSQKVNTSRATYGTLPSVNDVIMCALDMDNGKVWWGRQGTWFASGDPAAGTNEAFSGLSGSLFCYTTPGTSAAYNGNWGQDAFSYTPPSGFSAWG